MKRTVALTAVVVGFLIGLFAGRALRREASSTPIDAANPDVTRANTHGTNRSSKPFRWSQVESEDLLTYIENLRGIRCPEQIIRDITRARVVAMYEEKVSAISDPLAVFWSSPDERKTFIEQVTTIHAERDRFLESLNLQGGVDSNLRFLPEEKQRYVSEALKKYPKVPLPRVSTPEEQRSSLEGRRSRIAYLSQFLTPEELLDYRIAEDGGPTLVGTILRGMNSSDDEFRRVFAALDTEDLGRTNGLFVPEVEAKLESALGSERYAEYQKQASREYAIFNNFVQMQNFTDEQIQRLSELRAEADNMDIERYRAAVTQVISNRVILNLYFSQPGVAYRR